MRREVAAVALLHPPFQPCEGCAICTAPREAGIHPCFALLWVSGKQLEDSPGPCGARGPGARVTRCACQGLPESPRDMQEVGICGLSLRLCTVSRDRPCIGPCNGLNGVLPCDTFHLRPCLICLQLENNIKWSPTGSSLTLRTLAHISSHICFYSWSQECLPVPHHLLHQCYRVSSMEIVSKYSTDNLPSDTVRETKSSLISSLIFLLYDQSKGTVPSPNNRLIPHHFE